MKSIDSKNKPAALSGGPDFGRIPAALTVQRVERILSGKINPGLDNLLWTYSELRSRAPLEEVLLAALAIHIEKRKKCN